jgi:hypothetical protein
MNTNSDALANRDPQATQSHPADAVRAIDVLIDFSKIA